MIAEKLAILKKQHRIRERPVVAARKHNVIQTHMHDTIDFSSSDYLGICQHPKVKNAYKNAIDQYGFGSLASPVISGYYKCHQALEEKICDITQQEKTLLFNAGFLANLAALSCLLDKAHLVVADKFCHTSLLQGIQLSNAKLKRYLHNDMQSLESILQKHNATYVVTESVFSMDGDIAQLEIIQQLSQKYQANFIIDDAHGFGWLQQQIKTTMPVFQAASAITLSLSKTIATSGGAIAGKEDIIEYILQMSRVYQYSTGLSPVIAEGALATLEILEQELWRQQKLQENIVYFNEQAKLRNFKLLSDDIAFF